MKRIKATQQLLLITVISFTSLTSAAINFSSPQVIIHVAPPIKEKSFLYLDLVKEEATNIPPQFHISEAWAVSQMFTAGQGVVINEAEIISGPFDADSIICKFYGKKDAASSEGTSERAFTIGDVVNATAATGIYCQAIYFDFQPEYDTAHEVAVEGKS